MGSGEAPRTPSDGGTSTGIAPQVDGGPIGFKDGSISPPPRLLDATSIGLDAGVTVGADGSTVGLPEAGVPDVSISPPVDAGCTPTLPSGFSASAKGAAAPACTPDAITGTVQGCFLDSSTDSTCAPYAQGPCWACIQTPSTSPSWGAYVTFGEQFDDVNYGGCIAKIDPSPTGQKCGAGYAAFEQCLDQACVAACPPDETSPDPYAGLTTCENTAAGADCSAYQDAEEVACSSESSAANECSALLGYDGPQADGGATAQITEYLTLLCGLPASVDGGM